MAAQGRYAAGCKPPSACGSETGTGTPMRPATRPEQLSLDPQLCNSYLWAVARDKESSEGEKLADLLRGSVVGECDELLLDHGAGVVCPFLVASPVALQACDEDGARVGPPAPGDADARRARRSSCPTSWLLGSGVLTVDADLGSYRSPKGASGPGMWTDVGSRHDASRMLPWQQVSFGRNRCSSSSSGSSFAGSWTSSILSEADSARSSSPSLVGTDTEPAFSAPASPQPAHDSIHPEPEPVQHSRRKELVVPKPLNARRLLRHQGFVDSNKEHQGQHVEDGGRRKKQQPKPLSLAQLLGYGGAAAASTSASSSPAGSPVREASGPAPKAQGLSLRQLLGYGGSDEPHEEPQSRKAEKGSHQEAQAPKSLSLAQWLGHGGGASESSSPIPRSPVREASRPAPKTQALSLRQLLGYGGGEPDDELPGSARGPVGESLAKSPPSRLDAKWSPASMLLEELPFSLTNENAAVEGRVVSPPPQPARVAAMCAMRVKHSATGWL